MLDMSTILSIFSLNLVAIIPSQKQEKKWFKNIHGVMNMVRTHKNCQNETPPLDLTPLYAYVLSIYSDYFLSI